MSLPLQQTIVYGPVSSRRLGRSLGINVLPSTVKVCTFNCPYCQYGWTTATHAEEGAGGWPEPELVERAVGTWLERAAAHADAVDSLTLAGHGEPTLHPQFGQIVERLLTVRTRLAPAAKLAVLSNSTTAHLPRVRKALARLDERYMKLDAGDEKTLHLLNGTQMPVETILRGLRRLPDLVIQSMFVRDGVGWIDNSSDVAVGAWSAHIAALRPRAVHIYTIDRAPAHPYLRRVSAHRLEAIAARVRAIGVPALTFHNVRQDDELEALTQQS